MFFYGIIKNQWQNEMGFGFFQYRGVTMKRADLIMIVVVAAICAVLFAWRYYSRGDGISVVVTVDGQEYGRYSLNKNQEININDTNVLVIQDGEAYMTEAECPDQICVNMGHISSDGEMIVCLPNRVVVLVEDAGADGSNGGVDAVAN